MTCCFFTSLKALLTSTGRITMALINGLRSTPLAGFG